MMRRATGFVGYIVLVLLVLVSVTLADNGFRQYVPVIAADTGSSPPASATISPPSSTNTATPTSTAPATNIPLPTNTSTATSTPTATGTATSTNTPQPTNTVQPTATATEEPSEPGLVEIVSIRYDPDGSDVDGEYVRLRNEGAAFNMKRWKLHDEANTTFTFPDFVLGIGAEVNIWTGSGTDDDENLYWNSNRSIWNNDGDEATLKNKAGNVVDTCAYSGGGSTAYCS